jgi:hypothetical protein
VPARGTGHSRRPIDWQLAYYLRVTRPQSWTGRPTANQAAKQSFAADLPPGTASAAATAAQRHRMADETPPATARPYHSRQRR